MWFVESFAALIAQEAAASPVGASELPWGPKIGIVVASIVLGLLLLGLKNPQIWVIVSVLGLAVGVGAAVYGLTRYNSLANPMAPQDVEQAALAIGAGVGAAIGGFVLLVVAILRIRMSAEKKP
jgi:hypothetical protein